MKYASVIIGFLVLLLFIGAAFAFTHYGTVANTPIATIGYAPYNYQASVINAGYQNPPAIATAPGTVINAGYPYPGPQGTYGTVPMTPVVWYTSPDQPYYYNAARANVVYPYNTSATNYQYTYQYQNQYPQYTNQANISQTGTGMWYNYPSY